MTDSIQKVGRVERQQHTPEPWVNVPHQTENKALVQSGDGRHLAELWTLDKTVNCSANAARIVECVNACKGIKHPSEWITRARDLVRSEEELKFKVSELTDKLNEATNAAVQWKNDYEALQAQRDDLINALKEALRNPVRIVKATVAYFISKSHPVTDSVAKDAEWYANIIKHIEPAEAEKGAYNG